MLQVQHLVPRLPSRALAQLTRLYARPVPALWSFRHYLKIAPPGFALPGPPAAVAAGAAAVAA